MSASGPQIDSPAPETAPGISLSPTQTKLVGSVLDLFAGKPSKAKLALWTDDATFEDPLTIAKGRSQFEAQWYGLATAFSSIEPLNARVVDAGNPIKIDAKTKYTVKGVGKETTIESVIEVHTSADGERIERVSDKWNGKLPEGGIANVSSPWQLLSPAWWGNYAISWMFWAWSFVWYTRVWTAFRRLNAVSVPKMVSVPKSEADEEAKAAKKKDT